MPARGSFERESEAWEMKNPRAFLEQCGIHVDAMDDREMEGRAEQIVRAVQQHLAQEASILDEHVADEFQHKDADKTMETMVDNPYVTHLPTLTGGTGREEVHRFYRDFFIPGWPDDVVATPISRTVDAGRVIDELVLSFTHDRPIPAILPGLEPTGRRAVLPFVVVAGLENGKVSYEHIYWDQGSALAQLGVIDPRGLPLVGAEAVERLQDPHSHSANALMPGW